MKMRDAYPKLRELGYAVSLTRGADEDGVWRVSGHGLSVHVEGKQADAVAALVKHAKRSDR